MILSRLISAMTAILLMLAGCGESGVLNSPYPQDLTAGSTLFSSFSLRPKHLDPARSYSSNEAVITGQVYEPPLQYHYLKRPYQLEPLTARALPKVSYLNKNFQPVAAESQAIAYSVYEISIKPGILYQPHPAFAKDSTGQYRYHHLSKQELSSIRTLRDFAFQDTRELVAEDYVYEIKRLAHPELHSPILGLMSKYIVGLNDLAKQLLQKKQAGEVIDLRQQTLSGVKVLDRYTYQIMLKGQYPQFNYWLAMPFFAPIPWEADVFYQQAGLIEKNITLDWYPVGTGPYMLTENNPNLRMVLTKNPHFHPETYPTQGAPSDEKNGLLADKGMRLPFIDRVVFTLEKENISYWNKFLQGYYDISGISSDSFDQAIQMSGHGEMTLSPAMKAKGIALKTAIQPSIYYLGFNMRDPVVGGESEKARKLRQAISIAIDEEEYIAIFANGRGVPAQGPIPPGIFGYQSGPAGINPYVYEWKNGHAVRKPLALAKQLLAEAGYPDGRSAQTGLPLTLYFDTTGSGPDSKAQFDWMRKQFQKLNIQLVIRQTDYNRFQDKMQTGQAQIFQWGWNADYPDPENFLFLLYGPNAKVDTGGENVANYQNAEFDQLFEQMQTMPNNERRQHIIDAMLNIVRSDAPWIWGFHPKSFSLYHAWNHNVKPNMMANNTIKYRRIDSVQRRQAQIQWNQPVLWPIAVGAIALIILVIPAWWMYLRQKRRRIH